MLDKIHVLKVAVFELEKSVRDNDGVTFGKQLQTIREVCNDLKLATQPKETEMRKSLPYRTINTIPFMVKPVRRENLFEGNYLEQFSEERTEQLMRACAINNHNEFWKQHETIKGNIYGAVPEELIAADAVNVLINCGWERVEVDILDFGQRQMDSGKITEFCKINFDYYILVKETSTETMMALRFNI